MSGLPGVQTENQSAKKGGRPMLYSYSYCVYDSVVFIL